MKKINIFLFTIVKLLTGFDILLSNLPLYISPTQSFILSYIKSELGFYQAPFFMSFSKS